MSFRYGAGKCKRLLGYRDVRAVGIRGFPAWRLLLRGAAGRSPQAFTQARLRERWGGVACGCVVMRHRGAAIGIPVGREVERTLQVMYI